MRKVLFFMAAALLISCNGRKGNEIVNESAEAPAELTAEVVDEYELENLEADREEFAMAQEFIMYVVDQLEYGDDAWINTHCSASVIDRLKADNPYEGDGLALWELKSQVFDSEEKNMNAEVVGFGYGKLKGKPVYYLQMMCDQETVKEFAYLYYGLERINEEDFRITFFDFKVVGRDEE